MKHKHFMLITGIVTFVVLNLLSNALAQDDIITDCATVVDENPSFQGWILFSGSQDDAQHLFGVDDTGNVSDFGILPYSFASFYDPRNAALLLWVRGYTENDLAEDILDEDYTVDIWFLGPDPSFHRYPVPSTFRPVQWFENRQFVFGDYLEEQFLSLSTETGQVEVMVSLPDLPDIRAIPIRARPEYDLAFSPNGRYVVYETVAAEMVLWDINDSREIWRSQIPEFGYTVSSPAWNADSDQLVMSLSIMGEMELFIIDANTGQQTQLTDFPTAQLEAGTPPGLALRHITWSPNGDYIIFTHVEGGVYYIDVETMTVTDICLYGIPMFWLPSSDYLVLDTGNAIKVLNVRTNQVYSVVDDAGRSVGWSPLPISGETTPP